MQPEFLLFYRGRLILELDNLIQDGMANNMQVEERMQTVPYFLSKPHFIKTWYLGCKICERISCWSLLKNIDAYFTGCCRCSIRCLCGHICCYKWVHWLGISKISEHWKWRITVFVFQYWWFNTSPGYVSKMFQQLQFVFFFILFFSSYNM